MQKYLRQTGLAAILAALGILGTQAQAAPLAYSGGAITNDFDGLPTNVTNPTQLIPGKGPHEFVPTVTNAAASMSGWQLANPSGSSADTEFKSQDGSLSGSAGRGVISFGTNGSTERALGALPTSNQISTFGLVLLNTSSKTFDGFNLSYVGEQWRRGDIIGSPEIMTFAYGVAADIGGSLTNVPALSFASPNTQAAPLNVALDGNLAINQVPIASVVGGLSWAPGQTLVLRWSISEQSGQDDGLAIDNFSFTAVPEPSTFVLGALVFAGLIGSGLRVNRRSFGS